MEVTQERALVTGLDHIALKLLEAAEHKMRGHFVGLSFWSDGVPVSWDRKEAPNVSPGPSLAWCKRHIAPKHFCRPQTMDFVLNIFSWSLKQMLLGILPDKRHDGP